MIERQNAKVFGWEFESTRWYYVGRVGFWLYLANIYQTSFDVVGKTWNCLIVF